MRSGLAKHVLKHNARDPLSIGPRGDREKITASLVAVDLVDA